MYTPTDSLHPTYYKHKETPKWIDKHSISKTLTKDFKRYQSN